MNHPNNSEKNCTQCKELLPLSMYYRDRAIITYDAYRSKCKVCCKDNQTNRKKNDKNESIISKICSICNTEKMIDKFNKSNRHIDGYFKECKLCRNKKILNVGNNPKIKRTKEYMIEYNKKRYSDFSFKLKYVLRSNLSKQLKKESKIERTLKYIGCTLNFLIEWFIFLFDNNMTLDNHGIYWHIDHITPCSFFDLENQESIHKCYNWTNLRPCEAKENLLKGNKIDKELIEKYENLKILFLNSICYEIKDNNYIILPPVV
jgi:hypothetical protein